MIGNENKHSKYIKHTFCNFSSYTLSDKVYKVLSYGLDHHVPTFSSYNAVQTEFKLFYQNILTSILQTPEKELMKLKTKLGNSCHNHNK